MSKCAVCGMDNKDAAYVLMIRRDGSEAEMCPACAALINGLDDLKAKESALKQLKKHTLGVGDYEVRRFLEGVIASSDELEAYAEYVEQSRERKPKNDRPKRDTHSLVRPAALVLLVAIALYGVMNAIADITAGAVAIGIAGLVLTALIDGALLAILRPVMDALDDVRTMRRRMR